MRAHRQLWVGAALLALGFSSQGCTRAMHRIETKVDQTSARTDSLGQHTSQLAGEMAQMRSLLQQEGFTTDEERAELMARMRSLETAVQQMTARSQEQEALLRRINNNLDILARRPVQPGSASIQPDGDTRVGENPPPTDPPIDREEVARTPPPPVEEPVATNESGDDEQADPVADAGGEDADAPGLALGGSPAAEVYDAAFADFTKGNYGLSRDGFEELLRRYPDSELADNAAYWVAETYYAQGNYREAVGRYDAVLQQYESGDILGPALLKIGYCRLQLGDQDQAVAAFRRLRREYPRSDEAAIAENKLLALGVEP